MVFMPGLLEIKAFSIRFAPDLASLDPCTSKKRPKASRNAFKERLGKACFRVDVEPKASIGSPYIVYRHEIHYTSYIATTYIHIICILHIVEIYTIYYIYYRVDQ